MSEAPPRLAEHDVADARQEAIVAPIDARHRREGCGGAEVGCDVKEGFVGEAFDRREDRCLRYVVVWTGAWTFERRYYLCVLGRDLAESRAFSTI